MFFVPWKSQHEPNTYKYSSKCKWNPFEGLSFPANVLTCQNSASNHVSERWFYSSLKLTIQCLSSPSSEMYWLHYRSCKLICLWQHCPWCKCSASYTVHWCPEPKRTNSKPANSKARNSKPEKRWKLASMLPCAYFLKVLKDNCWAKTTFTHCPALQTGNFECPDS